MRNFKKRPHRVFIDKNKSPYFNINGKKVKILTKYNQGQLANKIINNYYQEKKKRRNNKKQAKKSASSYNSGIFSQQVKQNIIALENDNKLKLLELKDKELANTEKQLLLADVKKNAVAANMLLTEPGAAEDDALITMTKKEFERLARIVKNNKEAEDKKRLERYHKNRDKERARQNEWYAKNKSRVAPNYNATRTRREPWRGLARLETNFKFGRITFAEFVNGYCAALARFDERASRGLRRNGKENIRPRPSSGSV